MFFESKGLKNQLYFNNELNGNYNFLFLKI